MNTTQRSRLWSVSPSVTGRPAVTSDCGCWEDTCMHAYIHIHNHSQSHYPHASDWMLNSWKELNCNMQSSQAHALMMVCSLSRAISHRCKTGLPNSCSIQPRPTLLHAACHNYYEAAFTYFHNFANIRPQPHKKICMEGIQNEIRNWLAAQLLPISDGLVVNTEFRMLLEGRRMAPFVNMSADNNRKPG
jgi:hypothetical protein